MKVLKNVLEGRSIFFTGAAGTGKSHLLHRIIEALPPSGTYVTASTGRAAVQIGGTTLHSFAGIGMGLRQGASTHDLLRRARRPESAHRWRSARVLIIDEISMVDAETFDVLELISREIRETSEPFGGIQLVLTGDFLQLPPVSSQQQQQLSQHGMQPELQLLHHHHNNHDQHHHQQEQQQQQRQQRVVGSPRTASDEKFALDARAAASTFRLSSSSTPGNHNSGMLPMPSAMPSPTLPPPSFAQGLLNFGNANHERGYAFQAVSWPKAVPYAFSLSSNVRAAGDSTLSRMLEELRFGVVSSFTDTLLQRMAMANGGGGQEVDGISSPSSSSSSSSSPRICYKSSQQTQHKRLAQRPPCIYII